MTEVTATQSATSPICVSKSEVLAPPRKLKVAWSAEAEELLRGIGIDPDVNREDLPNNDFDE